MKQLTRLIWASIILGAFIVSSVPVYAGAYIYAGKRKKINCGIIQVNGANQPFSDNVDQVVDANAVDNLFYVLDQQIDMKPAGWSIENPLAPASPSTGLRKSAPQYWKINLSAVRDLSMMHVLYLPASGIVALSDHDREKLRKFVDGGGVLWIDNAEKSPALTFTSGTNDTFFIKNVVFESTGTGYDFPASRHHPLLTVPYWITEPEIMKLGSRWGQSNLKAPLPWAANNEPFEFDTLLPVVSKGNPGMSGLKISIGALAYGSGRVVATSNFVGRGCYLYYPYNIPSLKFAYNVIAWASSWTHLRKDPRHSGASIDTVGGTKLINVWKLPGANPNPRVDSAPVIYKNVVFYSSGSTVFALDLKPQDDLDQNGIPDDGFPGLPDGMTDEGQDIIWAWQCPDGIVSSPTVVTAMAPCDPTSTVDAVMVMSSAGTVYMLNAFPATNTNLDPQTSLLPLGPGGKDRWVIGVPTDNPYPPLYENGWIYAVAGDARLYAYSPGLECWQDNKTLSDPTPFIWDMPTKQPNAPKEIDATLRSGPSFGYVENESGGTLVGMVYWYTSAMQNLSVATPTGEQNDHIYGVPVMVSKDRLRIRRIEGNQVECQVTYTEGYISPYPRPRVWYRDGNGNMEEINSGNIRENKDINGTLRQSTLTFDATDILPADTLIYATYALNYGQWTGNSNQITHIYSPRIRQPLEPRTGTSTMPATRIAGLPAMGPGGMIYVNGTRDMNTSSAYGGSVYGIFNDGNTQLTKWHYFLHSGLDAGITGTSAEDLRIPGVIMDKDGFPMLCPMPFSSPVISGDKVFVTVSGTAGGPQGALLCFKANSDFVIRVTENTGFGSSRAARQPKRLINQTTGREMLVKVWQPNLLSDNTFTVNPLIEAVPVPKDMIDYQKGTITIDNFDRLKIRSAGDPTKTNTLSPSLPVWVFLDNVEVPVDFSTWGPIDWENLPKEIQDKYSRSRDSVDLSGWNNLLWYYIIPESTVHNSPVVIGDKVYVVADNGKVYALKTETGETAAAATAQTPIWEDDICGDFGGSQNASAAGSNGVLIIPGSDGLYAYTNATTLLADSNRLVELDGAGEISWALDTIMWPESVPPDANEPPPAKTGPINKPARVKYIGTGDLLLVNSGAHQVAKIDKAGKVGLGHFENGKYIRWIFDKFSDPRRLLRPGQPTSLQSPTDAILWQEVENGELVAHCVVADSGNHRVVDLVYRIKDDQLQNNDRDPQSGYYLPELNWVSKTDSRNDKYVYNSLQMVPVYSTAPGTHDLEGHNIWAAISSHHTGTSNPGNVKDLGRGGAVVALKYRDRDGNGWDYSFQDTDPAGYDSGTIIAACDRVLDNGQVVMLSNPRCFEIFQERGTFETHLLVADDNGVFEVNLDSAEATTPPSVVGNIFTSDLYKGLMRIDVGTDTQPDPRAIEAPLVANSVQKLPNNNWLITNGFLGSYKDSYGVNRKFTGEVFELDMSGNIAWCSPGIEYIPPPGGGPLGPGVPPEWRQFMDNSYSIQQPRSAFRSY